MTDGPTFGRLDKLRSRVRFGKFVSVGAMGATLETIVVTILTAGFGVYAIFAKVVGAEASISLMFAINDRWTFADEGRTGRRSILGRYLRSHLVRAGGLLVAFGTLAALVELTGIQLLVEGHDFWPAVANLIGIGAGMVVNYVAESLFTWRVGVE